MINCEVCGVTSVVDCSVDPVLMCGDCASKLNRITQRGCANCAGLQRELKELRDWRDIATEEIRRLNKRLRQSLEQGWLDAAARGTVDRPMSVEEFQRSVNVHRRTICGGQFASQDEVLSHQEQFHD